MKQVPQSLIAEHLQQKIAKENEQFQTEKKEWRAKQDEVTLKVSMY